MNRLVIALVVVAAVVGCGKKDGGGGAAGGDKPKVAVSIFPLYDLTRRIAGDRLDVVLVLPPGRSEHGYDPTPQEIARLEGTKLAISIGLDMDTWIEKIVAGGASTAKRVRIGDKVKTIPIALEHVGDEEAHKGDKEKDNDPEVGAPDPHVWLDPDRMLGVVDVIAGELALVDPAGKDTFAKNAEAVKTSLKALDTALAARAKAWSKHMIVTFHGSMTYYAARYGVQIAAVIEPLAGKEPTAAYIAQVLEAIKKTTAVALFSEPQFDKAPAETIAKDANIPLGELDPVGGVKGRESYEALLTWDTDQLEKLLK